ncbi:putative invasin [Xenorhabdus mauleonii]|uniref:Invasin n=1 Tax=Xenorhabdus mauleonii TaxID=351675 RepID=A0A1I3HRJ6_9GAMM|nr:inverse autotransporter beta domain-containing protein [Xenorhabdus mauleonii]PHM40298.1 putative invasin [Xenorhabdus mauleonii]SFI38374.1 Invasin, domain 3 [Xenorhabdus mauleonii]
MLKKQNRQWTEKQRHHLKWVAWANIFAQVAFPVAAAFTPAVASAKSEHHSRTDHRQSGQTRPYQLSAGENVKTVAKRHGLTVTELKKLNQQRRFHKPFAKLGAGDEIDVPHSTSDQLLANSLKAASDASATETPNTENSTERWLASTTTRAVGMLKSGNVVENTKNQLRGMAVSEANQAVQNWLQRYGNVKIQANVDDRGRLDGSQFDMLLPLYDTAKHLTFTQFGLRHIDSRTTANVGLGQRHFFDDGMFGYNAFLDHDITRDHTRFGIGAEYARDFMKFAANGYFRASGWKDGKKLTDYEERPANGFDLRAEGYMPTYPQLGGKLTYEQYFGNEVGLLSEERRQKNPAAFTLGVNYTPIPLVTLGLDRRQSASGGGETLFNLGLNYEIGTPWSKQVDPAAVAFKRTLQGGRYDLVDRNNQIVLEYRKKNLIRLMMETRISGRGGAIIPLNVTVSTKHGLKEIIWDTASLLEGGGKLINAGAPVLADNAVAKAVSGSTHYLLILPPYKDKGNNTYSLSGVAYDTQGNASERMEAQILVTASAVNPAGSGFEPAHKSMVADGKTQTVIRLKLTDKDGKPVSGAAGSIVLTDDKSKLTGDGKDPMLGTEIREVPEGSGIYEATVTAGNKHGKWTISPKVDGHELPSTVIDFGDSLANMIDTDKSEFKPDNGNLSKKDDSTDIVLHLKDKNGNPIAGAADKIKLVKDQSGLYGQGANPTVTDIKEDPAGSGIYRAKVTAEDNKGTLKITPVVDGKELKPAEVTIGQSLAAIVDPKGSAFIPATNILSADNEDSTIMTLKLKDKNGDPIKYAKDSITFEDNGTQLGGGGKKTPTIGKVWEEPEGSGIYKVKVTAGDKTGKWEITTKVDGIPLEAPAVINFATNKAELIDPNKSTFTAKDSELHKAGDTTVIEVELKDQEGNPISGMEKEINLTPDNRELYGTGRMPHYGDFKETSPGSGKYVAPVTAEDKKGKWTLTPDVFGKPIGKPATITFGKPLAEILNQNSPKIESVDGSYALPADGNSKKTLKITLEDINEQPITGAKDSIKVHGSGQLQGDGNEPQIEAVKEIGNGEYEVVIKAGQKTGPWTVTTSIEGTNRAQPTKLEFDENTAPSINIQYLEGDLNIGKTLTLNYQFNSNGSNATDRSFYVWGERGTTAARVMELAKTAGVKEPITLAQINGEGRVNGDKPLTYIIQESDRNKVLEVSILAANGANLRAKGPETRVAVYDPQNPGRITGGNRNGGVSDPNAIPSIDNIVLTGELELNKSLIANYKFNDNGGDGRDNSLFVWYDKGTTPNPKDFQQVPDALATLKRDLVNGDAGKTIAITIKPVNGKQKEGEAKTVDISMADTSINQTTPKGGKPGTILDPKAAPSIDNLKLTGFLYDSGFLKAEYEFKPNNGHVEDNSSYFWTRSKSKEDPDGPKENVHKPGAEGDVGKNSISSGSISSYELSAEDSGKLLEFTITPINGLGITGEIKTLNTKQSENTLSGGINGTVIDPERGPSIEELKIKGVLEMGQKLEGSYKFQPHGKDDMDKSIFLWGIKYPEDNVNSVRNRISSLGGEPKNQITDSGNVPSHTLTQEDSGHVIELAVEPRTPRMVKGEVKTILGKMEVTDTFEQKEQGNVTGGHPDGRIKGIATSFKITPSKEAELADGTLAIFAKKTDTDPIKFTIHTTDGEKSVGGVPVTIDMSALNRQKEKQENVTVKLNGQVGTYSGHTDENGNLVINVTDPDGIGTRTKLSITVNDSESKLIKKSKDVIFTVLTSPNTDKAKYWGHMEPYITLDGKKYSRPQLATELDTELDTGGFRIINHEKWSFVKWSKVENYCSDSSNSSNKFWKLPVAEEVVAISNANPTTTLYTVNGWPVNWDPKGLPVWTSTLWNKNGGDNNREIVSIPSLDGGSASNNEPTGGGEFAVICRLHDD